MGDFSQASVNLWVVSIIKFRTDMLNPQLMSPTEFGEL